jgi:N-acetyl-beta-hexosaminidase
MERNVLIGNKWWKTMTMYSKEMKTTGREDCMLMGGDFNGRMGEKEQEIGNRRGGWEKEIQRQGRKCRGGETDGSKKIDGKY